MADQDQVQSSMPEVEVQFPASTQGSIGNQVPSSMMNQIPPMNLVPFVNQVPLMNPMMNQAYMMNQMPQSQQFPFQQQCQLQNPFPIVYPMQNPMADPMSPFYLHTSWNPGMALTSLILTPQNYHAWARTMRLVLELKNKLHFIDGTIGKPDENDPLFFAWDKCNAFVVSWINLSLSKEILQSVLYIENAADLWRDLKQRYHHGDLIRIAVLCEELVATKQGELSVSLYFTKLKSLWEELENFRPIPGCSCVGTCNCGLGKMKEDRRNDYVVRFLRGLNEQHTHVRSEILLMRPLPDIDTTFLLVQQQEQQMTTSTNESAAFLSTVESNTSQTSRVRGRGRSGRGHYSNIGGRRYTGRGQSTFKICSFCGKQGHMVDSCYKKHRIPLHLKSKSGPAQGSAHNIVTDGELDDISPEISNQKEKFEHPGLTSTPEQHKPLLALIQQQESLAHHSTNQLTTYSPSLPINGTTGGASSPTTSSSFSTSVFSHDTFLSFRGEDTRCGFTGHLYSALKNRGINTFIDNMELGKGKKITSSLVSAIDRSRTAIVVLSKDYASSSFCLDELVNIMECIHGQGRLVFPIFYKVAPTDVRYLTKTYGDALNDHENKFKAKKDKLDENMERLERWKTALKEVAGLCGWHFKHGECYEYQFIAAIVELVSQEIGRGLLPAVNHLVGLLHRVQEVTKQVDLGSYDIRMVRVYRIGGVDKNLGTDKIGMMHMDFPLSEKGTKWDGKPFGKLEKMETLILKQAYFSQGPNLPSCSRALSWQNYPFRLPLDFDPKKLIIFQLSGSSLLSDEFLHKQEFKSLTVIILDWSDIEEIPDVSGVPNLEELSFGFCRNLIEVHESVGFLDKLKFLNAKGCKSLRSFPPIKLASLEHLNLKLCSSLENFPEILGKMENILETSVFGTGITKLPSSIANLSKLRRLTLRNSATSHLSISGIAMLPCLETLSFMPAGQRLQFPKLDEGEEQRSSMLSSNAQKLTLERYMSDECWPVLVAWLRDAGL